MASMASLGNKLKELKEAMQLDIVGEMEYIATQR